MSEKNSFRLSKLVREFNVKIDRILDFLSEKGIAGLNPNSKVSHEIYMQLLQEFDASKAASTLWAIRLRSFGLEVIRSITNSSLVFCFRSSGGFSSSR